jgi:hypothetical protein
MISDKKQAIEQADKQEPVAKVIPGTCKASEPPKQEPVAWMWQHDETGRTGFVDMWQLENGWKKINPRLLLVCPLYTTPPKPEWVGLTDEEIDVIQELPLSQNDYLTHYAYVIEAKLKDKNHG